MVEKYVYLAGPDVFRPNAHDHFKTMKKSLFLHNFMAISPIDNQYSDHECIYEENLSLIYGCDYVLANLDPFRGVSADVGTCVEIGYAKALNKTIIGYYTNGQPKEYKSRIKKKYKESKYTSIEDFNLSDNLMIINSCHYICNSFHDAVNILWHYDMQLEKEKSEIICELKR